MQNGTSSASKHALDSLPGPNVRPRLQKASWGPPFRMGRSHSKAEEPSSSLTYDHNFHGYKQSFGEAKGHESPFAMPLWLRTVAQWTVVKRGLPLLASFGFRARSRCTKDIWSWFSPFVRNGDGIVRPPPQFPCHDRLHFHGIWRELTNQLDCKGHKNFFKGTNPPTP